MPQPVPSTQWQTKETLAHAAALIGKRIVRRLPGGRVIALRITEVEAYDGENDKACHASRGRTPRTETLYAPGGVWYVYLCYGMHEMLNLVVGPEGWPAAILIRGIEGIEGPGRLSKALRIGRELNGRPAVPASGLWIEDDGFVVPRRKILKLPRIGVDYAGPVWAAKRWRLRTGEPSAPKRPEDGKPPRSRRRIPP